MPARLQLAIPAVAASLCLAACGSSSSSSGSSSSAATSSGAASAASSPATVSTASNSSLGKTVLVDAHGMTLYALSAEQNGKFICTSSTCLQAWHPLAASGTPSGGVGSLGTIKRPDGTQQVTYKQMPLYTFAQDARVGDAKGQGIKDVGTWNAVTNGTPSSTAPAMTTTSSSSSRYGY